MEAEGLATVIQEGLASEQELGLALKTTQTSMGVLIVNNVKDLNESMNQLSTLARKCVDKFTAQIDEMLESDTIDHASLFDLISSIQKNQFTLLDLQRKIVQSPNKIFSDDLLSNEEKKLLEFFKSFKTKAEKETFLKAVTEAMATSNEFE